MKKTVIAAGIVAALACADAAENFIKNPGLEEAGGKSGAPGWRAPKGVWSFVEGEGRGGGRAVRFKADEPYDKKSSRTPMAIVRGIEGGKGYRLTFWAKHDKLSHKKHSQVTGVLGRARFTGPGGKGLKKMISIHGPRDTADWYQLEGLAAEVPEGATECRVFAEVTPGFTGTAWFDDFRLEEYDPPALSSCLSSAYRNCAWEGRVTFGGAVTLLPRKRPGCKATLRYLDAGGKSCETAAVPVTGDLVTFGLDVGGLKRGRQDVTCVMTDAGGSEIGRATCAFERLDGRPKEWRTWIDAEQRLIADGKPLFPLSASVGEGRDCTDEVFEMLSAGFNAVALTHPSRKTLDMCERHGLKALVSFGGVYAGKGKAARRYGITRKEDEEPYLRRRLAEVADHPAVLTYHLSDEPRLAELPAVAQRRAFQLATEPTHPLRDTYDQLDVVPFFANVTDVVNTDPYPLGRGSGNVPIGQVTEFARTIAGGIGSLKARWYTIQAFDWKWYNKLDNVGGMPTIEEIENMSWQAIAGGANGLNYYAATGWLHKIPQEEGIALLKDITGMVRKIRDRADLLLSKPGPSVLGAGKDIAARTWAKDGETWLLAVNATREPQQATLTVGGQTEKVELPPLGRILKKVGGQGAK